MTVMEFTTSIDTVQVLTLLTGVVLPVLAVGVWVTAVATHYGLWKPTGVADTVAATGVTAGGDRT